MDRPAPRRALIAWSSFDWANSAFPTCITTFAFAPYFIKVVAQDENSGTVWWGTATVIASMIVAAASPFLGAVADIRGRRKPWVVGFSLLAIAMTASLWWALPSGQLGASGMFAIVTAVILATIGFELATVFYNAMLPDLASPQTVGRWSGFAWGLGYFGGLSALLALNFAIVSPDSPPLGLDRANYEHLRFVAPFVALWMGAFALPFFLLTPDRPQGALAFADALRQGARQLWTTFRQVKRFAGVWQFLIAKMLYIDGVNTIFAFGAIYAAIVFGLSAEQVLIFGIAMNVTAGVGAMLFGIFDDRLGPKTVIVASLIGMIAVGVPLLLVSEPIWFWVLGTALAIFFGPVQAGSRSAMAHLAPPELRTEMFGFFALAGRITSFIGPLIYTQAVLMTGNHRVAMGSVIAFLVLGLLVLLPARLPRAGRVAA